VAIIMTVHRRSQSYLLLSIHSKGDEESALNLLSKECFCLFSKEKTMSAIDNRSSW